MSRLVDWRRLPDGREAARAYSLASKGGFRLVLALEIEGSTRPRMPVDLRQWTCNSGLATVDLGQLIAEVAGRERGIGHAGPPSERERRSDGMMSQLSSSE